MYHDCVLIILMTTDLVLAHISSLAVAISAALRVSAGQLGLSAHTAAHLSDQGAVGVLKTSFVYTCTFKGSVKFFYFTSQHSGS